VEVPGALLLRWQRRLPGHPPGLALRGPEEEL